MPALVDRYNQRIKELADLHSVTEDFGPVHSSRLREKILAHFGDMRAEKSGREYLLFSEGLIGDSIRLSCDSYGEEAILTAKVAKIVRENVLNSRQSFEGQFQKNCQMQAVDPMLLSFVSDLLYGSSSSMKAKTPPQPVLTICQLIAFNVQSQQTLCTIRHRRDRELPLSIYLAMYTHAKTRKREIVDKLHSLGISISYDRMLRISSALCNASVQRFQEEQVVCPSHLRFGLFTTAAYDNLDHNPSSSTSEGSFHGTSLSIFQHRLTGEMGSTRPSNVQFDNTSSSISVPDLPRSFESVQPAFLPVKEPPLPNIINGESMTVADNIISKETQHEHAWLQEFLMADGSKRMSWSAFHASRETMHQEKSEVSLLPLFYEDSKSVCMVKHGIDVIKTATAFLNKQQGPVIAMDQPLYAVGKSIQWNRPETYGEVKLLLTFGSLHIEKDFDKCLGKYLDGSGWTYTLVKAGIVSQGVAESFIVATHITKTRIIHQITATALYLLMKASYDEDMRDIQDNKPGFNKWREQKEAECPMFKYWSTCLTLELLMLMFVRAHRSANYELYVACIKAMIPWFFAVDFHNYARWLPVYLRDLLNLPQKHPLIHKAFIEGLFVVNKTGRRFSAMGLDQAHEQNNAIVKGDGGAIGLLQDPSALRRWMIVSPEIVRRLSEFDQSSKDEELASIILDHHEQSKAFQEKFIKKVMNLKEAILDLGNPFCDSSKELFSLEHNLTMDEECVRNVMNIEKIGRDQYELFVTNRLASIRQEVTIFTRIPKNNMRLFSSPKKSPKSSLSLKSLKSDVDLFSKLFIICLNRQFDVDDFFCYENQPHPPSISLNGIMRSGEKALLLPCLLNILKPKELTVEEEDLDDFTDDIQYQQVDSTLTGAPLIIPNPEMEQDYSYSGVIYDGPAMTHILEPKASKTFSDYSANIFLGYIKADAEKHRVQHVDVVWDMYSMGSIKSHTREMRGTGARRQVRPHMTLPKNWQSFLKNPENKTELFALLAHDLATSQRFGQIQVISTLGCQVVKNSVAESTSLTSSNHEEADSRIFVHVLDAVQHGFVDLCIRTVDTDVVVLALSLFHDLQRKGLSKLCIHFGTGKHFKIIQVHELAAQLGEDKSIALRGFHAFTGCDSTSFFAGHGKKTMWKTWFDFPEVTAAFHFLSYPHENIPDEIHQILERYTILCYSSTSDQCTVNAAHKDLFTSARRTMVNIPPTAAVLQQHILRAAYQGGHIWGQSLSSQIDMPPLDNWGWKFEGNKCIPIWSTLPEVSHALRQLISCHCKTGCKVNCGCRKLDLVCTLLCKFCKGTCQS